MDYVREKLQIVVGVFAILSFVIFILVILLFKDRPKYPPSISEAKKRLTQSHEYSMQTEDFYRYQIGLLKNAN